MRNSSFEEMEKWKSQLPQNSCDDLSTHWLALYECCLREFSEKGALRIDSHGWEPGSHGLRSSFVTSHLCLPHL